MKILKRVIACLIALLCIGGIAFYFYSTTKFDFNKDDATGNTPGNLNNKGLFCEYEGRIYFANPYDHNYLYSMNSDCTDAKKLNEDSISYINICGKYIYYVKNNFTQDAISQVFRGQMFGVYRCLLNGSEIKALYSEPSGSMSLLGNYIYYQHYDNETALTLYKARIDGKSNTKLYDTEYSPTCPFNQKLYFANPEQHNHICYIDPKNKDNISTFSDARAYMVDITNNYLYYIDIDKHYSLVRMNLNTKTVELLYNDNTGKIVNFNVYGNKIFFQLESELSEGTGLYRMNIDGTQVEYIASGNLNHISCTSQYTFFQYFDNAEVLYRVPTTGTISSVEEIKIQ